MRIILLYETHGASSYCSACGDIQRCSVKVASVNVVLDLIFVLHKKRCNASIITKIIIEQHSEYYVGLNLSETIYSL